MQINALSTHDSNTPFFSLAGKTLVGRVVGVYDGDTLTVVTSIFNEFFKFQVRLKGIDTCEMKSKNEKAKELAHKARTRVIDKLLEPYGLRQSEEEGDKHFFDKHVVIVQIECSEFDKYGRVLADIFPVVSQLPDTVQFSKESLAVTLINDGLAYSYEGKTKLTEQEQIHLLNS